MEGTRCSFLSDQIKRTYSGTGTPSNIPTNNETRTGLYYLPNRYYDPTTTTFLTRYPIAPTTRQHYNYAGGDPLNNTDPTGLFGWKDIKKGANSAAHFVVTHRLQIVDIAISVGAAAAFGACWLYGEEYDRCLPGASGPRR